MLNNLCTTLPPSIFIRLNCRIPANGVLFTSRVDNNVDPDQLASQKPADLGPHCFQNKSTVRVISMKKGVPARFDFIHDPRSSALFSIM